MFKKSLKIPLLELVKEKLEIIDINLEKDLLLFILMKTLNSDKLLEMFQELKFVMLID